MLDICWIWNNFTYILWYLPHGSPLVDRPEAPVGYRNFGNRFHLNELYQQAHKTHSSPVSVKKAIGEFNDTKTTHYYTANKPSTIQKNDYYKNSTVFTKIYLS